MKNKLPKEDIFCPVCKSKNIDDDSIYRNNGIRGPGFRTWKIKDAWSCNDCGIMFKRVRGDGLFKKYKL